MSDVGEGVEDADHGPDVEEDFAPIDIAAAITSLLVHGATRDEIARELHISRSEVDGRIADATGLSEAEALNEREWIVREKLRDLTRRATDVRLATYDTPRLALMLDLAKLELALIDWARARQGVR